MNKLSPLALAISLSPSLLLAAQPRSFDESLTLPESVISSTRLVQDKADATSLTSVFTRADIERLQPSSVSELLRRVPGVQIDQSGGRGSVTNLYIRGTRTSQSLVLLDGQRIGAAASGMSPLESLSVDQIERIEVLRGPRSAVYGADAIGGVVQIFTRRSIAPGINPRVRLGYGSHSSFERSLGLSGGNQDTRFSLNASSEESDGINRTRANSGADADHDATRNNGLSLNLSHSFNDDLQAGLTLIDQRGENEYDDGWLGAYPYAKFQLTSYSGFSDWVISERWTSRVELGHVENRAFEYFDDVEDSSGFSTYRNSLAWLNTLKLDERHSLTLGADWYEDQLNSTTEFAEEQRWNQAAFVQHRYQGEHFSTELGVRHDKNELYGSENSWSGALTLPVSERDQLILSYSEGFRAPHFSDLYYPGFSNPNLSPELSQSYELQWRSQLGEQTRLEASVYRTDIRDAIVSDANWIPQNVAEARINGFEASLQHNLLGWETQLGLSIIDPRDRDSGNILARRAKRSLNLDLDRSFGDFSVGASWLAVSSSFNDAGNQQRLAGYGVLNLRGAWQATPELELALKLDNLLDRDYATSLYSEGWPETYYRYREEGRSARLAVTWAPSF